MVIFDQDWTEVDDTSLWHAAQDGDAGAGAELRRREMNDRTAALSPAAKAAMVSRARNGRPLR